ncbi:MAG: ribonuclease H-like domain-containing protein [Nitrospirae bacterium]|nr:ribonuclease H-like domain-containing protein [Nitrospirota bacterium]
MIRNTFSIVNGIGEKIEKRLWEKGILTWSDFINASNLTFFSPQKKILYDKFLISASNELENNNANYFANFIKRREHWRLFDIFKKNAICLDIETNGLMPENGGYITLIGIYDGFDYRCLIRDIDLTDENLINAISGYKYLITFYGSAFDIPFILRSMKEIKFNIPHFDVCLGARRIGCKGGLKKLEIETGIERDENVKGMDGYDAVKLWGYAKQGSSEALELLRIYNKEDTVNLFKIAEIIYQKLRSKTGIDEYL